MRGHMDRALTVLPFEHATQPALNLEPKGKNKYRLPDLCDEAKMQTVCMATMINNFRSM